MRQVGFTPSFVMLYLPYSQISEGEFSSYLQLPALSVKMAEISSTGMGYTLGDGIGIKIGLSVMLDSQLGVPTV